MATEKRSLENNNLCFNVSAIVVDIEGTTTSINFVKETLFPYVRENLKEYIDSSWSSQELKDDVAILKEQVKKDVEDKVEGVIEIPEGAGDDVKTHVINNVLWQMDKDRKTKALKQLQGHIWRSGYAAGKLVGHIYDDVKGCLTSWTEAGKKMYVYSSGSVEAQKLLFGSTKEGDLLPLFSGYFDTSVGAKVEAASYRKIVDHLKEAGHASSANEVLFLTDVPNEAKAAAEAGLETVIVFREGNVALPEDVKQDYPVIDSFCELTFQGNVKRRKLLDNAESVDGNSGISNKLIEKESDKCEAMEVCPDDSAAETKADKAGLDTVESQNSKLLDIAENVNGNNKKESEASENMEVAAAETKADENNVKSSSTEQESVAVVDEKKIASETSSAAVDCKNENSVSRNGGELVETSNDKAELLKVETPDVKVNGKVECKTSTKQDDDVVKQPEAKLDKEDGKAEPKQVDSVKSENEINTDVENEAVAEKAKEEISDKVVEEKTNGNVEVSRDDKDDSDQKDSSTKTDVDGLNKNEEVKETNDVSKSNEGDTKTINANPAKGEDLEETAKGAVDVAKTDVEKVNTNTGIKDNEEKAETKTSEESLVTEQKAEVIVKKDVDVLENGDVAKNGKTDKEKTDALESKTNGTHEEVIENGVKADNGVEEKKNGVAEAENVIKEKVEKPSETNGVTTAEVV